MLFSKDLFSPKALENIFQKRESLLLICALYFIREKKRKGKKKLRQRIANKRRVSPFCPRCLLSKYVTKAACAAAPITQRERGLRNLTCHFAEAALSIM
ncbi:hypothetical protein AVEN_253980-1 [Araneus ventricosus]|uniref:Uncharacterized protein n=1 Tax=Araneus ventricosus TaxID=182803 RepID=A0A4Y2GR69_ARAVE|nr:hypothetical protein AVEN_253980-1 [Araneus ventricosus]